MSWWTLLAGLGSSLLGGVGNWIGQSRERRYALEDRAYNHPAAQVQRLVSAGINPNSFGGNMQNTFTTPAVTANAATVGGEILDSLSKGLMDEESNKRRSKLDELHEESQKEMLRYQKELFALKRDELQERKQNYELQRNLLAQKYLNDSLNYSFQRATFLNRVKKVGIQNAIAEEILHGKNLANQYYIPLTEAKIDNILTGTGKLRYDMFNANRHYNLAYNRLNNDYNLALNRQNLAITNSNAASLLARDKFDFEKEKFKAQQERRSLEHWLKFSGDFVDMVGPYVFRRVFLKKVPKFSKRKKVF